MYSVSNAASRPAPIWALPRKRQPCRRLRQNLTFSTTIGVALEPRRTYMSTGAVACPMAETAHMHGGPWLRTLHNLRTLFNRGALRAALC